MKLVCKKTKDFLVHICSGRKFNSELIITCEYAYKSIYFINVTNNVLCHYRCVTVTCEPYRRSLIHIHMTCGFSIIVAHFIMFLIASVSSSKFAQAYACELGAVVIIGYVFIDC